MHLHERGGIAAGDASKNPTSGTFASAPPKSTYTGPRVAGTYGGFVGVFVACLVVGLFVVVGLILLRLRTLRRRSAREEATYNDVRRQHAGGDDEWNAADDAFEMPTHASYDRSHSTLDLVDDAVLGGGAGAHSRPYAAHDDAGVSQDTLYAGVSEEPARYRDPYADEGGRNGDGN
ncbi:hypothetical protein JCM10450v2_001857 [Rhodotorula kratochvilovae]